MITRHLNDAQPGAGGGDQLSAALTDTVAGSVMGCACPATVNASGISAPVAEERKPTMR